MSIIKAVVLEAPGPPEALQIRHLPIPTPRPGDVLIKVAAFGLNRSELHTRLRLAVGVTFPRVLGIEATGTVAACPGGEFRVGQQVATMMGGMGRILDGGYAEYTCVPARQVVPFTSSLDWPRLGAAPEMLQTQQAKRSFPCTGSTTWMRSRKPTPRGGRLRYRQDCRPDRTGRGPKQFIARGALMTTYKVGYFVGSLSSKSINRILSKALIRLAPHDLEFSEIPIAGAIS